VDWSYSAAVRRALLTLVIAAVAATTVALGIMPAHADGVGRPRGLTEIRPAPEPIRYTIMGDSHVTLMFEELYPGAHANGHEGTLLNDKFEIYGLNGISLHQVMNGRGIVKAGVSSVGTTNVDMWRQALRTGPDTVVVNLGTNDGGPKAADIDKFMRLAGKDRRVFWIAPYYTSCPACLAIHMFELKVAVKRHPNLRLIKVTDLRLDVSSDGLHAFGKASSQRLWDRIKETILPARDEVPASPR